MSKSKVLKIAGEQVATGQRRSINIPVARLYTHAEMTMPVHVLRGKKDGPRLFVCAAIHGDEIIGVEIIRRLLKMKILQRLRGTLIAVPVVNVYGFINHTRYLPDRRDLNRFFPGSQKGSLTSRLANIFMEEISDSLPSLTSS
jgi:predicted deacylase